MMSAVIRCKAYRCCTKERALMFLYCKRSGENPVNLSVDIMAHINLLPYTYWGPKLCTTEGKDNTAHSLWSYCESTLKTAAVEHLMEQTITPSITTSWNHLFRIIYGKHKGSKMLFFLVFRLRYAPCWSDEVLSTSQMQELISCHEHQVQ